MNRSTSLPSYHAASRLTTLRRCLCALLLAAGVACGASVDLSAQDGVTAFTHVNVVPMDSPRVLPDHTLLVSGGRITALGPTAEVVLPDGAITVDGTGLFLMPGLADMHAHLTSDPSPDYLRVFLAAGTTTLRNLNALPVHAQWKRQVLTGELVGPTVYTSGPGIAGPPDPTLVWQFWALQVAAVFVLGFVVRLLLRRRARAAENPGRRLGRWSLLRWAMGLAVVSALLVWSKVLPLSSFARIMFPQAYIVDTEARARAEVRRQAAAGYDLVKVYDYMRPEEYLGAIREAAAAGIYAAGHLDVGVAEAVEAGVREVVHVDEFLDFHTTEPLGLRDFVPVHFDYERIPETVALLKDHDVAVTVDLTTDFNTVRFLEEGPDYFHGPEYAVLRPATIEALRGARVLRWQPQTAWRRDELAPFLLELTRQLHDAGMLLLAGTDASADTGSLPSHIHDELQLMVAAGLSPFAALRTATVNASVVAERMGATDPFGQVAVGQRADLLLLRRNPLDDVTSTTERVGVMTRGRWYPQSDLDAMVAELIAGFSEG